MRGCLALGAIILAALAGGAASARTRTTTVFGYPVRTSGSIEYVFHGDSSRGCGAAHVCDLSGAISVTPTTDGDLTLTHRRPSELDLGDATFVVRVRRVASDGSPAECVENLDGSYLSVGFARRPSGATLANLGPLSLSHCATPLMDDLSRLAFPVRVNRAHPEQLDMRARVPFASGPYSGVLISTVTTRPEHLPFDSSTTTVEGPPTGGSHARRRLVERVILQYRVVVPKTTTAVSFSGGSRGCGVFDSCGVTGSAGLTVPNTSLVFSVSFSRVVRSRVSQAAALADFAAGRLPVDATFTSRRVLGTVVGDTRRLGAPDCQTVRQKVPLFVWVDDFALSARQNTLNVSVTDGTELTDALHAYCAGPTDADIFGRRETSGLLAGGVPVQNLGPRRIAVDVAASGSFHAFPYSGQRSGHGRVALTRIGRSAGTFRERVG